MRNFRPQHTGYYPYGEPWREPSGQHARLFAGKERVAGLPEGEYDFGPRGYRSTFLLWDSPDIKATDYPQWSPWLYCGANPISRIDPSGNWVFLIPFVKGIVGGAIDFSAQISVAMANDMTFSEAFDNVDWASVGASTVLGAAVSPGMSKGATFAVIATDAAVDIDTQGNVQSALGIVGEEKPLSSVLLDGGTAVLPAKGVESATKGFTNAVTSDLKAKSAATLTKGKKEELRQAVKTVNSEGFKTTAGAVADFTKGISVGQIKNEINKMSFSPKQSLGPALSLPRYTAPADAIKEQTPILIYPNGRNGF